MKELKDVQAKYSQLEIVNSKLTVDLEIITEEIQAKVINFSHIDFFPRRIKPTILLKVVDFKR